MKWGLDGRYLLMIAATWTAAILAPIIYVSSSAARAQDGFVELLNRIVAMSVFLVTQLSIVAMAACVIFGLAAAPVWIVAFAGLTWIGLSDRAAATCTAIVLMPAVALVLSEYVPGGNPLRQDYGPTELWTIAFAASPVAGGFSAWWA